MTTLRFGFIFCVFASPSFSLRAKWTQSRARYVLPFYVKRVRSSIQCHVCSVHLNSRAVCNKWDQYSSFTFAYVKLASWKSMSFFFSVILVADRSIAHFVTFRDKVTKKTKKTFVLTVYLSACVFLLNNHCSRSRCSWQPELYVWRMNKMLYSRDAVCVCYGWHNVSIYSWKIIIKFIDSPFWPLI